MTWGRQQGGGGKTVTRLKKHQRGIEVRRSTWLRQAQFQCLTKISPAAWSVDTHVGSSIRYLQARNHRWEVSTMKWCHNSTARVSVRTLGCVRFLRGRCAFEAMALPQITAESRTHLSRGANTCSMSRRGCESHLAWLCLGLLLNCSAAQAGKGLELKLPKNSTQNRWVDTSP